MALVRDRRNLNLRLPMPEPSERRPRFPLPLPPSSNPSNNSVAADFAPNDLENLQVLGHGNGGTVYKVRHKRTSVVYALKVVHSDSDPMIRRQVRRKWISSAGRTHLTSCAVTDSSRNLPEMWLLSWSIWMWER
ncbi:hypothetical protein K1719_030690 [Acacia pycnantha]|nr:hypothetical protein K1719_030690 [Acacia pycnantha]